MTNFLGGLLIGAVVSFCITVSVAACVGAGHFAKKHCEHIDSRIEYQKCVKEFLK